MKQIEATLAIVVKGDKILLGYKTKKNSFGEGLYNGFGGKVEAGESALDAAMRELYEESCLVATNHKKVAVIKYDEFFKGERSLLVVHVYLVTEFVGEPAPTSEMRPEWFAINEIPYSNMFGDDPYWLPLILKGETIKGFFKFDKNFNVLEHRVEIVESLEL